jgi:hypothetical protein
MGAAQTDAASLDALAQKIERIDQGEKMVLRATPLDISKAVIEFPALMSLTIPDRKCHVPWLSEGGIVMVYGPRGVGKTFFTLGLATALTAGVDFLQWSVTAPVGVLYVDGEMPLDDLRKRATLLMGNHPKAPFHFLSGEMVYHKLERDLVLTGEPMRDGVMTFLTAHPDIRLVILDNVSCLFPGINEDKKQDWEPISAWLIRLRHRGLASVLVHHAGKGGQQRGTSGREDALDTVIQIERPQGYDPREGCHFEVRFTKSRSVKGKDVAPLDVKLEEAEGALQWTFKTLEESILDQVKGLLAEGVTSVTDIAEELDISKGYASKLKRKAQAETGT